MARSISAKSIAGFVTKKAHERMTNPAKLHIARTLSAFMNLSANIPRSGEVKVPKPIISPHHNIHCEPPSRLLTYGSIGTNQTGSIMYCRNIINDSLNVFFISIKNLP
jgi:hypothetical protein